MCNGSDAGKNLIDKMSIELSTGLNLHANS